MSPASSASGVGLRREVMIVVPAVFLLLVALSTYTLFQYRAAVALEIAERQAETAKLAGRFAELIAADRIATTGQLRDLLPQADYFAISSSDGRPIVEGGSVPTGLPLGGFDLAAVSGPVAVGPDEQSSHVSAIAPTLWKGQRSYLRVDLRAYELNRQLRSVRTLTWVILPINAALLALVLLFLRQLLAPYDQLLAAVRRMRKADDPSQDEVAFLITSFEKAIQTLETERQPEEDLATLELALGPSLESGFLLLGRGGDVLALNPAGARLLGVESSRPGAPVHDLLVDHPELSELIRGTLESGQPIQRREVEIEPAGASVTLGLSIHPLRRDDGQIRGYLALFADLTETRRKAQEEKLSFTLEQVGELAAGVAHEMRNSLSTFRGYLTLIERAPDEEAITDYLSELRRETDHLQRVLDDFLSFARPESTRSELLRLESVVQRAIVDPALAGTRLEIEGGGPLPVRGDSQLLERAIRNLLHNASQAQESAGVDVAITVRLTRRDHLAVVEILDRGPGLADSVRDRLFEPFVTSRRGGFGLGLSLARRIVDLHGGRLELSDRAGGGARATLEIALVEEAS